MRIHLFTDATDTYGWGEKTQIFIPQITDPPAGGHGYTDINTI
jgi:hypothetical protein